MFIIGLAVGWALLIRHHLAAQHTMHDDAASLFAMWALMSTTMMAPTAVPVLVSLRAVLGATSMRPWWAFLIGYLTIWVGFSAGATTAQLWLIRRNLVGQDGSSTSLALSAALLATAGTYQFTSLKRRCLTECVSPMTFFLKFWRGGVRGGARMGARHGLSCLGCCWALMLLAFVGGVANIWFMVLSAAVMTIEKLPTLSRFVSVPLGVGLLAASLVVGVFAMTSSGTDHSHYMHHTMSASHDVDRRKGIT